MTKEFKSYWYRRRHGNLTEGLKGCIFWKDSSLDCDDKVDEEGDQIGDTMEISKNRTKLYYYNLILNDYHNLLLND